MTGFIRDMVAVAFKEVRQLRRDPISLGLTLVFPILLIALFIIAVTAVTAQSYNIPLAVADLDHSPASKNLVDRIIATDIVSVNELSPTEEQALQNVESGKVAGALIIPQGFGEAFLTHRDPFVVLQTDNSKARSSELIQRAVDSTVQDLQENPLAEPSNQTVSVEVIVRPISGRPLGHEHMLPSFLGMIILLGAFDDVVNAISRERERGTFPRLLLSPVNILSVYAGKISATVLLTLLRTSLVLMIFVLMGVVIHGSLLLIYGTTTLIAVFTLAVGLVVSSRIQGSSTLTVLEIAMTFPLLQLAGVEGSPELLASGGRMIARMLPWTYGNEALRRIIYLGLGFDAVAIDLLILFLGSLVLLPVATLLSKRTM